MKSSLKSIYVIFLLFQYSFLVGQNLIPNASFEKVTSTINTFTDVHETFDSTIRNWSSSCFSTPDLISKDNFQVINNETGIKSSPFGNNSLGLVLHKRVTPHRLDSLHSDNIWGESIQIKLKDQIEKDSLYLFSCWVSSNAPFKAYEGFGFKLTDSLIHTDSKSHKSFSDYYPIIEYPVSLTWKKFNIIFKAKKTCNYLLVGYIDPTKFPLTCHYYKSIDNLSLKKISNRTFNLSIEDITGVNFKEGQKIPYFSIFFLNNDYSIPSTYYATLDSLAIFIKEEPLLKLEIRGLTNKKGDNVDNKILSKNRAKSVFDYLISKGANETQLDYVGLGEEKVENKGAEDFFLSRRVDFYLIKYPSAKDLYKLSGKYASIGKIDSTLFYIKKIQKRGNLELEILVDPLFKEFFKTEKGKIIKSIMAYDFKKNNPLIKNPKLAFELKLLFLEDQLAVRRDKDFFQMRQLSKNEISQLLDSFPSTNKRHQAFLAKLSKNHTYLPPRFQIGYAGMDAIFAIVQHSQDAKLLRKYIQLFKKNERQDFYIKKYKAFMIDRLMVLEENKQIYGTQFLESGAFYPVKDPDRLNDRRVECGLQPFSKEELLMILK